MTPQRATIEQTMSTLCDDVDLNDDEKQTMLRLWALGLKCPILDGCFVPLRVWRAFYRRHPDTMLKSPNLALRGLAVQFKAQDDADAAMASIDAVISLQNVCGAVPGSGAGR